MGRNSGQCTAECLTVYSSPQSSAELFSTHISRPQCSYNMQQGLWISVEDIGILHSVCTPRSGYRFFFSPHTEYVTQDNIHCIIIEFYTTGMMLGGWSFWGWPGPLVPMKKNLNASAYQVILDNFMLPTLWEQFGEGPFVFQHWFGRTWQAPLEPWTQPYQTPLGWTRTASPTSLLDEQKWLIPLIAVFDCFLSVNRKILYTNLTHKDDKQK